MKRFVFISLLLTLVVGMAFTTSAQNPAPVPTLVPPTPIPAADSGESEAIVSESAIARIQQTNRVRIGILYNARPFGELNIRDEKVGFDADLGRALAEAWGVEPRFRQVTRQTAAEMLRDGEVDMLIAAQVHRRDLDSAFEFSQTYHLGSQSMMVRNDDGAQSPRDLANRRVGVVMGTASEQASANWSARAGVTWTTETYPLLDKAYGALLNSETDAFVASHYLLAALNAQNPEATRILDEPLELEPYAAVMRRGDVSMRNLVNRTLQYLFVTGKLVPIAETHFLTYAYKDLAIWANVGEEAPKPSDFGTQIPYPSQFVVPRLQTERVLRVAGDTNMDNPDLPESRKRLITFHRQLTDTLAARWGVTVQYMQANNPEEAVNLVANGQADLAIGIEPDWSFADRVDFTNPYIMRGMRLMVPTKSNIGGFENLIGGLWIAVMNDEPNARAVADEEARKVNVLIRFLDTSEGLIYQNIVEDDNANVAFADITRLLPYVEQYPDEFTIIDRWYTRTFMAMAVPRNDSDFRVLLEYTMQEMARDDTLRRLLTPVTLPDKIPTFEIWSGMGNTFGFKVTQ